MSMLITKGLGKCLTNKQKTEKEKVYILVNEKPFNIKETKYNFKSELQVYKFDIIIPKVSFIVEEQTTEDR